jgi:CheY-like chemotaxis protein
VELFQQWLSTRLYRILNQTKLHIFRYTEIVMKTKVLVIDDNPIDLKMTKAALSSKTYDIVECSDLQSATQLLTEVLPHIIVCDLNFEGAPNGGLDWLEKVRAGDFKDIPVIISSGSPSIESVIKSRELHVDSFVVKSPGFARLVTELARIKSEVDKNNPYRFASEKDKPGVPAKIQFPAQVSGLSESGIALSCSFWNESIIENISLESDLFEKIGLAKNLTVSALNKHLEPNRDTIGFPFRTYCSVKDLQTDGITKIKKFVSTAGLRRRY